MKESPDRLDSWKAIGDYLGRDIRTLQRWETQGLPIRRVAGGGRGSSVFAYKSEIDAWMKAGGESAAARPPAPVPLPVAAPELAPPSAWKYVAAALVMLGVFSGWFWRAGLASDDGTLVVHETTEAVVATTRDGKPRWTFAFPSDVETALPPVPPVIMLHGATPGVLATTAVSARRSDGVASSGVVRWFGVNGGDPIRTFAFDDRRSFAGVEFSSPWTIADVELLNAPGPHRIAVAARHNTHWPGLVTILDERFARHGTFVNSGWVLAVRWLGAERLVISGFNEEKDGGMIAVLDASHLDGASPDAPGSAYACDGCAAGRPLFYAVFPRSELNTVTASRFNGAGVDVTPGGGLTVHTKEMERETEHGPVAEAVYDFSPGFALTRASYGTDYWDRHRALELQGKVTHTQAQCPERNGPPIIYVWAPATGWRTVKTPR